MEIIILNEAGFCWGVKRSINIAKQSVLKEGMVETIGPLIHNREFVKSLEKEGIFERESINYIKTGKIVIKAHGIPKWELGEVQKKGWKIFDATCPVVKRVYELSIEDFKNGYFVCIFGNPEHPEIKGVASYLEDKYTILKDLKDLKKDEKISLISQTTEDEKEYLKNIRFAKLKFSDLIIHKTICPETKKRQKKSIELAKNVDFMIVVGGKNSSNTKKLFQCVTKVCPSIHIENENEIDFKKIKNFNKIGITSGTSTPREYVERIARKLKKC